MIDFRLHTFLSVYCLRSFTRSAEALFVTQPAVTQHIRHLEAELGVKLFEVKGRIVRPTEAAGILKDYAETVEADARRTRERMLAVQSRKDLRFGATRTIGEFLMPRFIARWLADYPDSQASLAVDNTDALLRELDRGTLDFLCVEGRFDRDSYTARTLCSSPMAFVCPPEHPLAGKSALVEELLSDTFIAREQGSGGRMLVEDFLGSRNLSLKSFNRCLEIGSIGAAKDLVRRGCGIAVLYEISVEQEIRSGALARIDVRDFSIVHDFTFACKKNTLYEKDFIDFFAYCSNMLSSGQYL